MLPLFLSVIIITKISSTSRNVKLGKDRRFAFLPLRCSNPADRRDKQQRRYKNFHATILLLAVTCRLLSIPSIYRPV
jgi:hypothetical protein